MGNFEEHIVNGNSWLDCVPYATSTDEETVHRFKVNQYFGPHLAAGVHMLVCDRCGMHIHARFEVRETSGREPVAA